MKNDSIRDVGTAWVKAQARNKKKPVARSTQFRWVITKSVPGDEKTTGRLRNAEKPAAKTSPRFRNAEPTAKTRRQADLARHLEKQRAVTLGCVPLNRGADVKKSGRVSYGSVVNPPEWNQGEAVDYSGAARIARRRRAQRG